jgi:hypothetical protein
VSAHAKDARYVRTYTLLHPLDCEPPHGLVLAPGSRDELKVARLAAAFSLEGFNSWEPALVGYPLGARVQLLTGTHRREAALRSGILLPVSLWLRSYVEAAWGTDKWATIIEDVPVCQLERVLVSAPSRPPALEDRVVLS